MSRLPRLGRRRDRHGQQGQMVILFALCLTVIIAFAGLLVDGGRAWGDRRIAQTAADTAALAAAKAIVAGTSAQTAANTIAAANGIPANLVNCAGTTVTGGGVVVNRPPSSGPHSAANDPTNSNDYVEVITTRAMRTTFSNVVGQSCWLVSARSVSSIGTSSVAKCSFCSLNKTDDNHTLVLKNGATLRVDGDIYVNSTNGGASGTCAPVVKWFVCGDGFDVFGDGGFISAQTISVAGGWETHDDNPVKADELATVGGSACPTHPDPPNQTTLYPTLVPSNVCIHMPQISDPLYDMTAPRNVVPVPPIVGAPVAGSNGCPSTALIPTGTSASPSTLTITTGTATICPGTYYGGVSITGGTVTMTSGVYYIAGGGFAVSNAASLNGTAGVMIYNASGIGTASSTNPGVDLVPAGDKSHKNPKIEKGGGLTASPNKNVTTGTSVTFTMEIERNSSKDAKPTGTITFYEGQTAITGCSAVAVVNGSNSEAVKATCTTSWATSGSKAISAVYSGDSVYNAIGDAMTLTISASAATQIKPININTTGAVQLYGETSGTYKGLTIFQERTSNLTITLSPGTGSATACPSGFMTTGVPNGTAPAACGALGGLRGTIYAPASSALVYITASGLANLQVISGKIQVDSDADARFAFTPQWFANGDIRLVE